MFGLQMMASSSFPSLFSSSCPSPDMELSSILSDAVHDFSSQEIDDILGMLNFNRVVFFSNSEHDVRIYDPEGMQQLDNLIEQLFGGFEGIVCTKVPTQFPECPVFMFVMKKHTNSGAPINFKLQAFLCKAHIKGISCRADPVLVIGYSSMRHGAELCDVPYHLYTYVGLNGKDSNEIELKDLVCLDDPKPSHNLRFACTGCTGRKSRCSKCYPCELCLRRGIECVPARSEGSVLRRRLYEAIFSGKLPHSDMAKIQMHFQYPHGKHSIAPHDVLCLQSRLGRVTTVIQPRPAQFVTCPEIDRFISSSLCYKVEWMFHGHYHTTCSGLYKLSIFDSENPVQDADRVGVPVALLDLRGCTDAKVPYLLWSKSVENSLKVITYRGYVKRRDGQIKAAEIKMLSVVFSPYNFICATVIVPS